MSDNDLDKIVEKYEKEYEQALNSTPVLKKRHAGRHDALVDRLASYCKNRAYCRRELATLLPLYGPQLEELIMRAVSLSEGPIDELIALLVKHSMGEATDDDIADFLEGRRNIAVLTERPRSRAQIWNKLQSKITRLFLFFKQIIRK